MEERGSFTPSFSVFSERRCLISRTESMEISFLQLDGAKTDGKGDGGLI